MALQAVAGSKFFIGTRVALPPDSHVTLADFAAQQAEWLEVKGWTQSGSLGDTRAEITQPFIGAGRDQTIKGTANAAAMENTFAPLPNDPGQARMRQAVDDCSNYAFKIEWGAGCTSESAVSVSVASPGVFTWPGGHGLEAGSPVMFSPQGGDLPEGLSPDVAYYVAAAGLTPTTFSVSETPGGAAIAIAEAGSAASIIATAQPAGSTDLFYGLAFPGAKQGGEANTPILRAWSVKPNTNIVEV